MIEQLNASQLATFVEIPVAVLNGRMGKELQKEFSDVHQDSLITSLIRAVLKSACRLSFDSKGQAARYIDILH